MQYKNPCFFALMDLDDDGRLKNVFWADPRSRAAYQDFGDVITFDTTYLTNKYGMPFAPFVGVNHHGQSILLGAGLISSEDTETFTWKVQQQVMGVLDIDPSLLRRDGLKKTYLVEDEICVEEFTKHITYYVDFNEEDCDVKCSCGLFQMKGILCRHVLTILKCNGIKYLPDRYILNRWRKDIKRRYTLIQSNYDTRNQREDTNRYSSLLNICYRMITHAAGSKEHTKDTTKKLYAMIDLYHGNQEPPKMTQTDSNVGLTTKDTTTIGSSQQVLNPRVVRGKGRPSSLRRASRMEQEMRKVKARTKKANAKEKRKEV
ncbi:protein FAR1-RELATED SEQUENCE 5-like [Juglans microcarpa x Juglans regia]|uniref:protein FAR1-RELATED SEQUENCE 5-like n=1 Tax=Juglans microcarpa x Juglans regia TaxID=2249226 RepID=UPI001B7DF089|nr:protein FAR1-RELATED SEQUENCE 5-like [Juglans microcarpa x Juglans regia]